MTPRRVLVFLALPVVQCLISWAWYGLRTTGILYLVQVSDLSMSAVGWWFTASWVARAAGLVLGGVLAAIVGPEAGAAVGALVLAAGLAAFWFVPGSWAPQAFIAVGVASGIAEPGVLAAAARAFPRPAHQLRNALFFLLFGAIQLGATGGSYVSGLLAGLGMETVIPLLAIPALLAAVIAAVTGIVGWRLAPWPVPEPGRRGPRIALGVAVALFVLLIVPWGLIPLGTTGLQQSLLAGQGAGLAWIFSVEGLIGMVGALAGAAVCGTFHFLRWDVPALLFVGAGLLLSAVGGAIGALSLQGPVPLAIAAQVVLAGGQALATGPLLSRLAGDVHWRVSALLVGAWFAADVLFVSAAYVLMPVLATRPELPMLAAVGLSASTGLVVLLAAVPVQRLLARADEPEPQPETAAA